jgi:hypothetical protein
VDSKELNSRPAPLQPCRCEWGVFGPPFLVVHGQLLGLAHVEGEVVVLSVIEIASSVDRLGRYANWSGPRVSGMMMC